eukprot:50332-Eustigmatos_ZCMA.PRE.1
MPVVPQHVRTSLSKCTYWSPYELVQQFLKARRTLQDYHRKMRRDVIEYLTTTAEAVELAALVENVTPAEYLE